MSDDYFIGNDADVDGWDALTAKYVNSVAQCINNGGDVESCLSKAISAAINESRDRALDEAVHVCNDAADSAEKNYGAAESVGAIMAKHRIARLKRK